jgi:hypothetical protein
MVLALEYVGLDIHLNHDAAPHNSADKSEVNALDTATR